MDLTALLLSRLQLAFTVSFYIIFPSFTIGLAAWLTLYSWMQVPVGYALENGAFVPNDWSTIILSPVVWLRFPHRLLASNLAGAFGVAASGAYLFVFPAIGALAAVALAASVRYRRDQLPFHMVALIFIAAFGTIAISFWPYTIPFSITIAEAAAPRSSLAFMFWGAGLFVFPPMLLYTIVSYTVFRGRAKSPEGPY